MTVISRVLVLGLIMTTGCTMGTMVLPGELKQSTTMEPLTAKGGGLFSEASLDFGPFVVVDPKKGWVTSSDFDAEFFVSVSKQVATQNYEFRFGRSNKVLFRAYCRNTGLYKNSEVDIGSLTITNEETKSALRCALIDGEKNVLGRLVLKSDDMGYSGRFSINGADYEVSSEFNMEGKSWTTGSPMGYVFQLKGIPLAAVQVKGPTAVWWHSGLDRLHKLRLAGAMGALFYFTDLRSAAAPDEEDE